MIIVPSTVGLILCDRLEFKPDVGQASLVGVLHALRFPQFPSPVRPFTAYAALYDGFGEATLELAVSRVETDEVVDRYQRWAVFPDRLKLSNLEINLKRCVFPAPGIYDLVMRFDGK